MQRDQFSQKQQNSETFYGPTVVFAECKLDSKKSSDAALNCNYAIDN